MARLGERLIAAGSLHPTQLEEALRAQVLWGGRLGTNLIDLEVVSIEDVSAALSAMHHMPIATRDAFERANAELQRRLTPALALDLEVVPLAHTATNHVGVACISPLGAIEADVLAKALHLPRERLLFFVAAELRVRYYLERVYGLRRPTRFLRIRTGESHLRVVPSEAVLRATAALELATPPPAHPITADDEIDVALDFALAPFTQDASELALATVGEFAATPVAETVADPSQRQYLATLEESQPATLGRMSLQRKVLAAAREAPPPETLEAALRAIRRGNDRNTVARLAMQTLREHGAGALELGAILVVRDRTAIGWLCTDEAFDISEIAVSLNSLSLLTQARESALHVTNKDPRFTSLDGRLFAALGASDAFHATVAPVVIGDYLLCYLVAWGEHAPDASEALIRELATTISHAFLRLIRAANR